MPFVDAVDITVRLTRLEDEHRRLKRLVAATALLSLVSVAFISGAHIRPGFAQEHKPDLETVQAYEYVLRDSAGRMRAHLFFSDASGSPTLAFYDADGRSRLIMSADQSATSILAYSPDGGRFVAQSDARLGGATVQASTVEKGAPAGTASLFAFKQATQISVEDSRGFRTIVGNTAIEGNPGQKPERTSAASVVMYQKGGHIVWQAPPERAQR